MRNIFLFIRRNFNFLFFLVLQIIALSFLFRYNRFHEAAFMGVAGELTGRVSARYSDVEYYFLLKKENAALVKKNEELLNLLQENFQSPDSSATLHIDSLNRGATGENRKFLYKSARILNNTVSLQNNYLTIHRGLNQGIRKDMGVISSEGIVGTVVSASENFAVVMSLLNRQSSVSAKLKKTGEVGKVLWNGKDPSYITMLNIPKSASVAVGDTVVTSGYSLKFPEGVLVGFVEEVNEDRATNFFSLKLRTANNFYNATHVYVIENLQREEQQKLEEAARMIDE